MIKVNGLAKSYKGTNGIIHAVKPISFDVPSGTIVGLLGPNGAGKTTLLRMLASLLKPDEGSATVCGHDLAKRPTALRKNIGFLSPSTRLYGRLTVLEALVWFGRIYGVSQPKRRAAELLERLQLEAFAHHRCDTLSTGNHQKASLARAMIHNPPLLILDEPTTGLDVLVTEEVLEVLREAKREGRTVLLSTHIMRIAEQLCDHFVVINEGSLLGKGTLEELQRTTGERYLEDVFRVLLRTATPTDTTGQPQGEPPLT